MYPLSESFESKRFSFEPEALWKFPGKCIGNISEETWSGSISLKASSELRLPAGNISIVRNRTSGDFPRVRRPAVSSSPDSSLVGDHVYPDPRGFFLDSSYLWRKYIVTHNRLFDPADVVLSGYLFARMFGPRSGAVSRLFFPGGPGGQKFFR